MASSGLTLGERWRRQVQRISGRHVPICRRVHFARALNDRYACVLSRVSLARAIEDRQRDDNHDLEPFDYPWRIPVIAPSPTDPGRMMGRRQPAGNLRDTLDSDTTHLNRGNDTAAASGKQPLQTALETPQTLAPQVSNYLSGVLRMQIPAVKIYTDQAADRIARQFDADAVSFGQHILFRAGRYDPHRPRGLALLGHELTHAANARMAGQAPSFPGQSPEFEETVALRNEQAVLDHASFPAAAASWERSGLRTIPPAQSAPLKLPPRTAATGRDLDVPHNADSPASPVLAEEHMTRIKDEVYRDLMDRIRTEFERGA